MVRYNLLNSGVVGPRAASFLGVVLPWLVAMFCYQGSMLVTICNWSALLTIGVVNLIVPIAVYCELKSKCQLVLEFSIGNAEMMENCP